MSKAGRKRTVRALVFYVCAFVAVALVWINKSSIWMGVIVFLNNVAELFDSLAG